MTFPPRWSEPHFKHDAPNRKVEQRTSKLALATAERRHKDAVRKRDKTCRFPLCGCKKFRRHTEVSHAQHKGAGGNPAGDRSATGLMTLLCPFRHRENRVSLDKGTLRWRPLTDQGANGPIVWEEQATPGVWVELARERAVQELDVLAPAQRARLKILREMRL